MNKKIRSLYSGSSTRDGAYGTQGRVISKSGRTDIAKKEATTEWLIGQMHDPGASHWAQA